MPHPHIFPSSANTSPVLIVTKTPTLALTLFLIEKPPFSLSGVNTLTQGQAGYHAMHWHLIVQRISC